jgi:crotonobetainyl-CoA:carnitine CoA-transferase CaiB-like acyl-CoA transferase
MLKDPHYAAREMIRRFEVETLGREIPMAAPVPKFSRTENKIETVGPRLGQHTNWALKELIKISDDELTALSSAGVIL